MSSLSTLEAPSAILAATEGIGLAALGLGKEAHIDLLYKSQVGRSASADGLWLPCSFILARYSSRPAIDLSQYLVSCVLG